MSMRVTYILSYIEKSLPFEWVVESIDRKAYNLSFILLGRDNTPMTSFLAAQGISYYVIPYRGKRDLLPAIFRIFVYLKRLRSQVVHAHLFYAGMTAMPAAWLAGVRTRIYTRHYSTYHHDYFKGAVRWDRWINRLATRIVAISPVVEEVLVTREQVKPAKIARVPHGFDFRYFIRKEEEVVALRARHHIPEGRYPYVGVISRYTHLKGIQYIIEAFKGVLQQYPHAHLVLANAQGDYKATLTTQLQRLSADAYTEIAFEENVRALYGLFDVFVHVPISRESEAFGQTYVEALAMHVPSVFTQSGIANEFLENGVNACQVPYHDAVAIEQAIKNILTNDELRDTIVAGGYQAVTSRFGMAQMMQALYPLYGMPGDDDTKNAAGKKNTHG
jgi:glycosyltransferase involved in cell wall biosynthesis